MTARIINKITSAMLILAFIGGIIIMPANTVIAAETGNKIVVNGEGRVNVVPDIAYISLGVSTENAVAKKAQDENNELMRKVIDAIKAEGIADKDIQTTNYSIYPQRNYQVTPNKIISYIATNTITVSVRDIKLVGTLIDKAMTAGANVGDSVRFSIIDSTKYYEEAMALALKNAASKAESIAKGLNATLSKQPVEVIEQYGSYMPYNTSASRMSVENSFAPIQTGELTVTANLQVTYSY